MVQDEILKSKVEDILFNKMDNADIGINVEVAKGLVTLTGIVDVLSEKEYAEKATLSIPGIIGVENAIAVSIDGKIDDDDINQKVINRFFTDPRLDARHIGAITKQGIVYLKGHVKTLAEANIAQELAKTVMGVKDIVTQVNIGDNLDIPLDNASLANAVEVAFSASGEVSAQDIRSSCKDRYIYLDGIVDSEKEKNAATYWASTVPGVKKVINRLSTRLLQ